MVPKLGTCIGDGMMTSRFKARTLDLRDLGAIDLGVPPQAQGGLVRGWGKVVWGLINRDLHNATSRNDPP